MLESDESDPQSGSVGERAIGVRTSEMHHEKVLSLATPLEKDGTWPSAHMCEHNLGA